MEIDRVTQRDQKWKKSLSNIAQIMVDREPLPQGWEARWDPNRNAYFFIDHNTRQTTWVDPRLNPQRKQYNNRYHGTQQPAEVVHQTVTDQSNAKFEASVNALLKAFPQANQEVVRAVIKSCQNNHTRAKLTLMSMGFKETNTSETAKQTSGGGTPQGEQMLNPRIQQHTSPQNHQDGHYQQSFSASPNQRRSLSPIQRRSLSPIQRRSLSPNQQFDDPLQNPSQNYQRTSMSFNQEKHIISPNHSNRKLTPNKQPEALQQDEHPDLQPRRHSYQVAATTTNQQKYVSATEMASSRKISHDSYQTIQKHIQAEEHRSNKDPTITTFSHSLSPKSPSKHSSIDQTSTVTEGNQSAVSPSGPRNHSSQFRDQEVSTAEQERLKQRLLGQFPECEPEVVELALSSTNFNVSATRVTLEKWEGRVKREEEQRSSNDDYKKRTKSDITSPTPDVSKTTTITDQPDNYLSDQQSNESGENQHSVRNDNSSSGKKISLKTLLVTSQVGSPFTSLMSRLPGMTCCFLPYKSSTNSQFTSKVVTSDIIPQSSYRTAPHGPNPALPKGPNKSLLSKDSVQATGPNLKHRQGPDPHNVGMRVVAVGPNPDLVQGPISVLNGHSMLVTAL
ncbi:uncharacterized protein LOC133196307 [Saccostrea echinata]|uniref:uncharacterized protein LOC133196307 n=1 Tax=Saccostrea echinata TaxID=191078 RepID=UPI002A8330AC|nr:uncharacterized protein LOC133196307 [Saccostrea echinata]